MGNDTGMLIFWDEGMSFCHELIDIGDGIGIIQEIFILKHVLMKRNGRIDAADVELF